MQDPRKNQNIVEILLESTGKKFNTPQEQMCYERGYLTGILLDLSHSDSFVYTALKHKLEDNYKKRKKSK